MCLIKAHVKKLKSIIITLKNIIIRLLKVKCTTFERNISILSCLSYDALMTHVNICVQNIVKG
jgi:hypothetical protein